MSIGLRRVAGPPAVLYDDLTGTEAGVKQKSWLDALRHRALGWMRDLAERTRPQEELVPVPVPVRVRDPGYRQP